MPVLEPTLAIADDLSFITRGHVGKDDFEILCVLGSGGVQVHRGML